ncbi:hypothetical protein UCRNP2_6718 [Neofusicoccum parvum UCRNP2]|uniref:CCHC-type domain-containing protein n=1 Tax=Botryosphaeria parva (strain UCR-NP2) TaxID=1287680 RepID=R1GKR6_BOTPV|nr:hypothetical protein UCRNP2_6718 [Neofusicoccum parvum UCRNP2]
MHNKLEINADHYKTERAKISYVFSRTTGIASDTIRPNVHEGPAAFQTVEEAFTLLTSVFDDPHFLQNKRQEFRRFYQNTTPFNSFYAKFIALATESELPRDQWFEEMWTRLSGGLRHGLAPVKDSLNSSFQDLTARARTLDRELQNDIKAAEKKKERANKLLKNTKPTVERTTSGQEQKKSLTAEERDSYRKEGSCFHCHQKGHMANACPTKAVTIANAKLDSRSAEDSGKE